MDLGVNVDSSTDGPVSPVSEPILAQWLTAVLFDESQKQRKPPVIKIFPLEMAVLL